MIRNSILALLLVQCCLVAVASRSLQDELYEAVCPLDYSLILLKDGSEEIEGSQRKRRWLQEQDQIILPPIEIVRQSEEFVQFTVQNSTSFEGVGEGFIPEQLFVSYHTDVFGSEHCLLHTEIGPVNGGDSSTDIRTAHCFDSNIGRIALVKVFARSLKSSGGIEGSAAIPKCCQDPYADTVSEYNTFAYVYEIRCAASCDAPNNYYAVDEASESPTESANKAPPTTSSPTTSPTVSSTAAPTGTPTASPVVDPTAAPTKNPTASPVVDPTAAPTKNPTASPTNNPTAVPTTNPTVAPTLAPPPPQQQCNAGATSPLSRDLVMGKQMNGPHWGSRHPWAWPGANNNGCSRYASVDDTGTGADAWPCSVNTQMKDNRVLGFDSSYLKFRFKFDDGMKAEISLAGDDATAAASAVTLYPSGVSASTACSTPPESKWDDYPVRLVKSGRYHHHWYAERVNCNGGTDDTRIEIKVTPDCVELHMVSNDGAQDMNWLDADNGSLLTSSTNGYSAISYCVQCDSEINGDPNSNLSGCSIVETPLPTDCCLLNPAGSRDGNELCGTGWNYSICPASSVLTTEMTKDVTLSTVEDYDITADGHSFQVAVPRGSGNQMVNDDVTAIINNNSDSWKKVKINFHIQRPRRVTGVSGVLVDPTTGAPTGIHVQMSKNWHENRPSLYDSYWWTGIAHFRVPPGETRVKLVVAYQYYEGLHGVSHSQLSLLGWATNGLWEEVGLGSNGESITYEPHGHHRRQMILDTRPFLVCQMGTNCNGSPDSTQWTENVGGGDFLNAVDKRGMYQYLVEDTVYHTMNGPRLTNATYAGVTVDTNIAVSRTVSTWTADDFVRHLHSFQYDFLKDTDGDQYPRFSMYTLGGDNYNYVQFPLFAYGAGDENSFLTADATGTAEATVAVSDMISGVSDFTYTDYYSVDAPVGCSNHEGSSSCWFAMMTNPEQNLHQRGHRGIIVRNFRGRLNGEAWPPASGEAVSPFTFNLIKSRQNGSAQNTVSIELGLPASFKAAVDLGLAEFREGDFLSADIELLVPPRQDADYFGDSDRLRDWMTDAGVNANYADGWKIIAKEAVEGDAIQTTVFVGELERLYHPRMKVACPSNEARFNIRIPTGMPGILPITIAGVGGMSDANSSMSSSPLDKPSQQLWRYDSTSQSWKQFATGAAYQLEKDVLDNSYTFVYSLVMEFQNDSSGPPVIGITNAPNACEQFFFGVEPPSDTNPSC